MLNIMEEIARLAKVPKVKLIIDPTYKYYNSIIVDAPKGIDNGLIIGKFGLHQFPGCCGICVLFHVYSYYKPNIGIGKLIHILADQIAYHNGYRKIMAADRIESAFNPFEVKILKSLDYTEIGESFINKRTNRTIVTYSKILTQNTNYTVDQTTLNSYQIGFIS